MAGYRLVNISVPTFQNPILVNSVDRWIIIHQNLDDTTDSNHYWAGYKAGFDVPGGNFWIGLERMHQMTSYTQYRLRVEVQSSLNKKWYSAEYDTFLIDSEAGGYAIHVTGYHGDAGYSIQFSPTNQNGMKFSTKDVNNTPESCESRVHRVIENGEGNWYYRCHCFLLTGHSINNRWCTLFYDLRVLGFGVSASRMLILKY